MIKKWKEIFNNLHAVYKAYFSNNCVCDWGMIIEDDHLLPSSYYLKYSKEEIDILTKEVIEDLREKIKDM